MSDKELAVQLASGYLNSFYASGDKKALDPETAKKVLQMFYDAVTSLPDNE